MKKIKIILADDHKVFLDGLESLFANHQEIEVCGTATHGRQVLSQIRSTNPDMVVLDIDMPEMNGVETAKRILSDFPEVGILMLSVHGEISYIKKLMEMGVHGYLLKEVGKAELIDAIKILAKGGNYFSKAVREIIAKEKFIEKEKPIIQFTKKEVEVLKGLAEGWGNEKIAEKMDVESSTVDTHLKSIRRKTNLTNQRALVKFAIDNGFK